MIEATTTEALTITQANTVLDRMEQVAKDAEERAAALRTFVNLYRAAIDGTSTGQDPEAIAGVAAFVGTLSFHSQASEKVDECLHVHSGSTHGSNGRQAMSALAAALTGEVSRW